MVFIDIIGSVFSQLYLDSLELLMVEWHSLMLYDSFNYTYFSHKVVDLL